jgi:hypothetical protein
MMEYPPWQDMTEKEKLEFLNEWCRNMSRQIEQQTAWTNEILSRLSRLEAKAGGAGTSLPLLSELSGVHLIGAG